MFILLCIVIVRKLHFPHVHKSVKINHEILHKVLKQTPLLINECNALNTAIREAIYHVKQQNGV